MPALHHNLPAAERIALAVDTSDIGQARELTQVARVAGARVVKLGLEISSATSWSTCSELAGNQGLDWIADAKIDDIPNTAAATVKNLVALDHPPLAITIHANSGIDSLKAAQDVAGEEGVLMLGVTHLTSIDNRETVGTYRFLRNTLVRRRLNTMVAAGIGGLVCSPRELRKVVAKEEEFRQMIGLIPGTRSEGSATHDQKNPTTPQQAIEAGASILVIGRQITQAADPERAFSQLTYEIQQGLDKKEIA